MTGQFPALRFAVYLFVVLVVVVAAVFQLSLPYVFSSACFLRACVVRGVWRPSLIAGKAKAFSLSVVVALLCCCSTCYRGSVVALGLVVVLVPNIDFSDTLLLDVPPPRTNPRTGWAGGTNIGGPLVGRALDAEGGIMTRMPFG